MNDEGKQLLNNLINSLKSGNHQLINDYKYKNLFLDDFLHAYTFVGDGANHVDAIAEVADGEYCLILCHYPMPFYPHHRQAPSSQAISLHRFYRVPHR